MIINSRLFKYDEKLYAEEILKNGFVTNNLNRELKILGKYYKYNGMSRSEIRRNIIDFCEKNMYGFNYDIHFRLINNIVNYSNKPTNNILIVTGISLYDSELDYVNSFDFDDVHKKVMLGLIIQNKLNMLISQNSFGNNKWNNYFGGNEKSYSDLKKSCGVKKTSIVKDVMHDFYKMKLVSVKIGHKTKLDFIDNIEQDGNVICEINDFDNYGLLFEKLNGNKKIAKCNICGKLVRKKSNKTMYCNECAKHVKNEQNKTYYKLGK